MTDDLWMSVHLGWMLLWTATFCWSSAMAVYLFRVHRRERRRRSVRDVDLYSCVYLDTRQVMAVHGTGRAGRRRVGSAAITRIRTFAVNLGVAPLPGLTAGVSAGGTTTREYGKEEEPGATPQAEEAPARENAVNVLGAVVTRLEKHRRLIQVDLDDKTITPGSVVAEAFGVDGRAPATLRLSSLRGYYVWITGDFESTGRADRHLTFAAPYAGDARVHIGFIPAETQEPPPRVHACLGKVDAWNAQTRTLVIHPMAVFR
ncbi:hypothetical protein [Herbidospora daliensis]|uniref:hypothetical protein n=1 Tax=Herbidospora daliensis TaxID=295585 RepID=UPI000782AA13|nr:hypothetical protein [Herbidospora daliensis]